MQATAIIFSVAALILALYGALIVDHLPTHEHENRRIYQIETWIRSRCVSDSLAKACLNFKKIEPTTPNKIFKLPY